MGAEAVGAEVQEILGIEAAAPPPPLVVGLQPSALVDHLARVDSSLLLHIPGAKGGSLPVYVFFSRPCIYLLPFYFISASQFSC